MTMKRTTLLREGAPSKDDAWVVLNVRVLNVSNFLSQQRGGELTILTFAGKDAPAEFDRIHHPDVVEKVSPQCHHLCCRQRQGQNQLRELPVLELRPPDAFFDFFDQLKADGFCGGRGPEACASRSALFRRLVSDLHAQRSILAQLLWAP